jgi:beta-galactosidase
MHFTRFIERRFSRAATVAVLLCASGVASQALGQPRPAPGKYPLPTITTQPASRTVTVGQKATFSVAASGSPPLTFQWRKNGVAISGAKSLTYTTPATTSSYNGVQYTVAVTDVGGTAISKTAVLTVDAAATPPPTITQQPVGRTVTVGQTAGFEVAASGTPPLRFQWRKNGVAISGATSLTYFTPATTSAYNGAQYSVAVTDPGGTVISKTAVLTVDAAPSSTLTSSATSLAFGSVNVSSSSTKSVTLSNAGNASIAISNVVIAGAGFTSTGVSSGLILSAGKSATLDAAFDPAAGGAATGSITITSNASNSPMVVSLSGTGVAPAHSVSLHWAASTSSVIGYNVYSSTTSGGPYTKLTSAPVPATDYTDASVQAGKTYYYVVTSVNSDNEQSGYSAQVSAVIP